MKSISAPAKQLINATQAWENLNGIVMVHKISGEPYSQLRHSIRVKLCKELNEMKVRPPRPIVKFTGDPNTKLHVNIASSYADNVLVVGPRYQFEDIKITTASMLGTDSSGLMVLGINDGTKLIHKMKQSSATKLYKVKGLLGEATDNYFITGKIVERSTYKHIRHDIIDKISASFQSAHQKKMFEFSGVDMQSQAAYELALKGPIRPADNRFPMIYSIKCTEFNSPEFTLEIVCMNETEMYLKEIIHEMGLRMNSTATCTKIHCMQYAVFDLKSALVKYDWTLANFQKQMKTCKQLLQQNYFLLQPYTAALQRPRTSQTL